MSHSQSPPGLPAPIEGSRPRSAQEQEFARDVADARMLLDFALKDRPMSIADPDKLVRIPDEIIRTIGEAEQWVSSPSRLPLIPGDRAKFDAAYQDLALLVRPVTVISLKATDQHFGRHWGIPLFGKDRSIAEIFSYRLWIGTIFLIALAITGEMLPSYLAQFADTPDGESASSWFLYLISDLLKHLTPFTYGGIGACAYLLKTAHQYIYRREFDPRRISEYGNRVLLGIVSGGAVTLFVSRVTNEAGETVTLGASALGFLAGYNTDFLFSTIERVVSAILPKVGVSSVKRDTSPSAQIQSVSLEKLLEGMKTAQTPEERKTYQQLISKIESRL